MVVVWYVLEQLTLKVKQLYKIVCELEEEKYDWEMKIKKQDFEVCLSSLIQWTSWSCSLYTLGFKFN